MTGSCSQCRGASLRTTASHKATSEWFPKIAIRLPSNGDHGALI
jgi:hypothetical protein